MAEAGRGKGKASGKKSAAAAGGASLGGRSSGEPVPIFFESGAELEAWLEQHHATAEALVVGLHRKETGRRSITYPEMLEAALCFGWIDGIRGTLGDGRWTVRLTPRREKSGWSRVNIRKAQELMAAGRMRPAGVAAFEGRDASRSEVYSAEQQDPRLSPAEEAEFQALADAWAYYQGRAPSYRRATTWWVVSAKRPETRRRRLETLLESCTRHISIPEMTAIARRKTGEAPARASREDG